MIKKILVISQPGTQQFAMEKAIQMAGDTEAQLHLVINMYEPPGLYLNSGLFDEAPDNGDTRADDIEGLTPFSLDEDAPVNISYQVISEKYCQHWVLEHTESIHYDLIIYQALHDSKNNYSLTDWELFRRSHTPVYIATGETDNLPRLLVSLDLLSESPEKQALNSKLLDMGARLAQLTGYELHACGVIGVPRLLRELDPAAIDEAKARSLRAAQTRMEQLLTEAELATTVVASQRHIDAGVPFRRIADIANEIHASCLILGTLGRRGLKGKLIGNTSEKVIQMAHCDLLVVNPDD